MKRLHLIILTAALTAFTMGGIAALHNQDNQYEHIPQTKKQITSSKLVKYIAKSGMSSLDQLKNTNPSVITKSSKYGEYVDSINNLKGGDNNQYWSFYVDGKLSNTGASDYIQKGGEIIEWKFQKL